MASDLAHLPLFNLWCSRSPDDVFTRDVCVDLQRRRRNVGNQIELVSRQWNFPRAEGAKQRRPGFNIIISPIWPRWLIVETLQRVDRSAERRVIHRGQLFVCEVLQCKAFKCTDPPPLHSAPLDVQTGAAAMILNIISTKCCYIIYQRKKM